MLAVCLYGFHQAPFLLDLPTSYTTYAQEAHHGSSAAARIIESGSHGANDPIYEGMKRIIPEDQKNDALRYLADKVDAERLKRAEQAYRYADTLNNLETRVNDGEGNCSWLLTKEGSRELARDGQNNNVDPKKFGLTKEQVVTNSHIVNDAFDAGTKAAAIAVAVALAPVILETLNRSIKRQEIDLSAFYESGSAICETGVRAFLSGSISAGVTAALKTHEIETNPSVVAFVTVIAINVMICAWKVAQGEMTRAEMAEAVSKGAFVASMATVGGLVGQAVIDIPVLGYMVGSLIGSTLGSVGYAIGKNVLLGLCVERGYTFFGLVEQDYALPKEALEKLGIDAVELDMVELEAVNFEQVSFEEARFDRCEFERVDVTVLKRGLLSISKVGYC